MSEERQHIGRYRIKREIGRGGMAVVYLAHDPRVERDVALKILPPHYKLETDLRERFEREAKIIASLEHPAIVPIYDYGEEEGQPYLVMRYMSGGSLDQRILRTGQRLSLDYVFLILERIAAALDIAHDAGVIHRDLKPSNILLDQYNNPFLADFGIVKLVKRVSGDRQTSTIVGTPAYMSPEQAQGVQVDRRSDIYGLGAVLFEMLTGHQPYEADSITGLLLMQVNAPIPQIQDVAPDVSAAFQQVIDSAMAKSPTQRFSSASAMAAAFGQAMRSSLLPNQDDTLIEKPDYEATVEFVSTVAETPEDEAKREISEEKDSNLVVRLRPLDIEIPDENGDDEEIAPPRFSWQQLDSEPQEKE
jgi:serine/threonine-protein kinase